jgi:hypothetical protein
MAVGSKKYIDEVANLAYSLVLNSPEILRAVITDSDDQRLLQLFDIVVPYDIARGNPFQQKTVLDIYSPFQKTLFLDADCLVVRSLIPVFELFDGYSFCYGGGLRQSGEWYGQEIAEVSKRAGVERIARLNTGMLYFDMGQTSTHGLFDSARHFYTKLSELNYRSFRAGLYSDEPAWGLALGRHMIQGTKDNGRVMKSDRGTNGRVRVNILRQFAHYRGLSRFVQPAIIHPSRKNGALLYAEQSTLVRMAVAKGWFGAFPRLLSKLVRFRARLRKGPYNWFRRFP